MNIFFANSSSDLFLQINRADLEALGNPHRLFLGYDNWDMFYITEAVNDVPTHILLTDEFYQSNEEFNIRLKPDFTAILEKLHLPLGNMYVMPSFICPIDVDGVEHRAVYYSLIDARIYTPGDPFNDTPEEPAGVFQDERDYLYSLS